MAFWGIEVTPGKPYVHQYDNEKGRLHVSQATLIPAGSSTKRSVVQCKVGANKPINLCSFLPEKLETCALNLEFEEDDQVTFSVLGPHSVHLSGFFFGDNEDQDNMEDDVYGSDLYGEDMMATDSEEGDDSIGYDSEDEDEDDEYSDDDDFGLYSSSPVPNSGVRIEEIVDEEKPANESGMSKQAKKKKSQLKMSNGSENSNHQIVVKSGTGVNILESEDEDGFPIPVRENKSDTMNSDPKVEDKDNETNGMKPQKKKGKDDNAHGKKLKRKIDADGQDAEPTRKNIDPVQADNRDSENVVKQKKNKKKKVAEKEDKAVSQKEENAQENGTPKSVGAEESQVAKTRSEKKKEKKKKNKQQQSAATPNTEEKLADKRESVVEKKEKAEAKSSQVRTFPNGLMIEELAMGKPDGKRASPGKKVSVRYIGKLKKNNKIFDSNTGRAPFKFRLGIGEVIKGWDVGVNGMRIGDKRRLTIPPPMGYGPRGCPPDIPPNSWLVFDVELVDVN